MSKKLKCLLLQARNQKDPMAKHELNCFINRSNLKDENFKVHDLINEPINIKKVKEFDALFIGGSGEYYASKKNLPTHDYLIETLHETIHHSVPSIGVCYGYHYYALTCGAKLINDPPNTEVGTFDLKLTENGKKDELFKDLPLNFKGQLGHKDRIIQHPESINNLASSDRSPFQAFRIEKKPIWAIQFHPELTKETNLERFLYYQDGYSQYMSEEERENTLNRFQESPESSALLEKFIKLVF